MFPGQACNSQNSPLLAQIGSGICPRCSKFSTHSWPDCVFFILTFFWPSDFFSQAFMNYVKMNTFARVYRQRGVVSTRRLEGGDSFPSTFYLPVFPSMLDKNEEISHQFLELSNLEAGTCPPSTFNNTSTVVKGHTTDYSMTLMLNSSSLYPKIGHQEKRQIKHEWNPMRNKESL